MSGSIRLIIGAPGAARAISAALAAGALIASLLLPSVAGAKPAPRYYLALGDSLSQGMQPDVAGATRDTNQGYSDDLAAFYGAQRGLTLVKFGCGGDSTTSMLTGKGNEAAAQFLKCNRTGGSQLAAAVRFLQRHRRRGEVALVTLDIGANDVDFCAAATDIGGCVTKGFATIRTNLPKILSALRRAAAPSGAKLAAMTLYDPILGGYFSTNAQTKGLATASVALAEQLNTILAGDDQQAGFVTADVAGAFASSDSKDTVTWEGQQIPVNVARVCSWTWACQTPPSGPNIHANKNGYEVIATAFQRVIGRL